MRAWNWVRAWIQTNLIGTGVAADYTLESAEPPSVEEELTSAMEESRNELLGPSPIGEDGEISKRAIDYWVEKLIKGLWSAVGAALAWLFWRATGKRLLTEEQEHLRDVAEVAVPLAIWIVCFLSLTARRVMRPKKGK